ncbi:MAG: hypothetical protein O9301_14780 [Leptospira sp.]|nr:hypothetical protein [Leptospira sp.]
MKPFNLQHQIKNILYCIFISFGFIYPLFAGILSYNDEIIKIQYNSPTKSDIQFCLQKENFIFGKNSYRECKTFSGKLDSIFESYETNLDEPNETQWAFYDYLGRQIFPDVTIEGNPHPFELQSIVRSKRGQTSLQLLRKKDRAYFFLRVSWNNIVWE